MQIGANKRYSTLFRRLLFPCMSCNMRPTQHFNLVPRTSALACVSQKTRKLYGPEKPFVKLRPAYSVKLVLLYVVKEIKIKITAKFCDTEHFRFEDTKRIMSPEKFRFFRETGPQSFGRLRRPGNEVGDQIVDTLRLWPTKLD